VADILLGHTLAWARSLEQPLPAENLKDYTLRLRSRPAFQRMVALSRS
jgi:glutathione S-transferase